MFPLYSESRCKHATGPLITSTPVTLIPWLCPVSTICSAMDWAFPVTVPYTQLNLGDIFRSKPKFSC